MGDAAGRRALLVAERGADPGGQGGTLPLLSMTLGILAARAVVMRRIGKLAT